MYDFEPFRRDIEAALPGLNQLVDDEWRFARIAWGGADSEHNEFLKKHREDGWPIEAGLLVFDDDDFELKLYPRRSDNKWSIDSFDIMLSLGFDIPVDDLSAVCKLLECQTGAQIIVCENGDDSLFLIGVEINIPRNQLDSSALAHAIYSLRATAGEVMELVDELTENDDEN